jgi:hypothetical protein
MALVIERQNSRGYWICLYVRGASVGPATIWQNTITFIFFGLINDLDFLRRHEGCSCIWVATDITARLISER